MLVVISKIQIFINNYLTVTIFDLFKFTAKYFALKYEIKTSYNHSKK